jgi:DNA-binding CsgD family transcriptional regulator
MDTQQYLDIETRYGSSRFPLVDGVIGIGRSADNAIVVSDDSSVSRAHALIERLPAGWAVRDLGSRNGTFVNGTRIWSEYVLHPSDRIEIGSARLTFRQIAGATGEHTSGAERPPELTPRERDIVRELCRPGASGNVFTEPASIREIGAALFITEAAVKQHLAHLYDKFGLRSETERRRTRLANEAVRRGVVSLSDLVVRPADDDSRSTNPGQRPVRPTS